MDCFRRGQGLGVTMSRMLSLRGPSKADRSAPRPMTWETPLAISIRREGRAAGWVEMGTDTAHAEHFGEGMEAEQQHRTPDAPAAGELPPVTRSCRQGSQWWRFLVTTACWASQSTQSTLRRRLRDDKDRIHFGILCPELDAPSGFTRPEPSALDIPRR